MTVKEMYEKFADIIAEGKGDYQVFIPSESGFDDDIDVHDNFKYVYVDSMVR